MMSILKNNGLQTSCRSVRAGMVRKNKSSLEIEFARASDGSVAIESLYLDPHEEGALVVNIFGNKFIFFLDEFGDMAKVETTASRIACIVNCFYRASDKGAAYLVSFGQIKQIRLKEGQEEKSVESTTVFSNNVVDFVRWTFRFLSHSNTVPISVSADNIQKV